MAEHWTDPLGDGWKRSAHARRVAFRAEDEMARREAEADTRRTNEVYRLELDLKIAQAQVKQLEPLRAQLDDALKANRILVDQVVRPPINDIRHLNKEGLRVDVVTPRKDNTWTLEHLERICIHARIAGAEDQTLLQFARDSVGFRVPAEFMPLPPPKAAERLPDPAPPKSPTRFSWVTFCCITGLGAALWVVWLILNLVGA